MKQLRDTLANGCRGRTDVGRVGSQPAAPSGLWVRSRGSRKPVGLTISDLCDALREQKRAGGLGRLGRCQPRKKSGKPPSRLEMEGRLRSVP